MFLRPTPYSRFLDMLLPVLSIKVSIHSPCNSITIYTMRHDTYTIRIRSWSVETLYTARGTECVLRRARVECVGSEMRSTARS